MPYFSVLVHGTGVEVPSFEGEGPPIVGFYANRVVTARDANEAFVLVSNGIRNEWSVGKYARANRGAVPTVHLDEAFEISFLSRWFRRPRGYTFYTGDDDADKKDGSVPAA
jgi:hypothetical protein